MLRVDTGSLQYSLYTICTRFFVLITSPFYPRESCWTQKRTRVTTTKWWPNVLVLMFNWLKRELVLRSAQKIVSSHIIQGLDWLYDNGFILLVFEIHFDLCLMLPIRCFSSCKLAPSALAGVRLSLDPEGKIMAPRLHNILVVFPICRRLKNSQFWE